MHEDPTGMMIRAREVLDTIDYLERGRAIVRLKEWVAVLMFQPAEYPATFRDTTLREWNNAHTMWVFVTALETAYHAGYRYGREG